MHVRGSLLLLPIAFAGCFSSVSLFPHAYLLEGREIPTGLTLAATPFQNPGPVPESLMAESDDFIDASFARPDEAWGEWFYVSEGTQSDDEIGLLAMYWKNPATPQAFLAAARNDPDGSDGYCDVEQEYFALVDGNVVVFVWGDGDGKAYGDDMVAALKRQNPSLKGICE